jgi:hypothetical protein
MNDKHPDQGAQDQGQNHYSERTVAGAPPTGDDAASGPPPTGDDAASGPPPTGDDAASGPPPTGDERVDDALAGLSRLRGRPADEHVAVLEEVHGQLRDILGELAEAPEPPEGHEHR